MKNIILLIIVILFCSAGLSGQDRFPIRQLTSDPAQEGFATWSPDGKYIVFQHTDMYDTLGKNGLWRVSAEGGKAEQIFEGLAEHPKWSPDGTKIAFTSTRSGSFDIWIMDIDQEQLRLQQRIAEMDSLINSK